MDGNGCLQKSLYLTMLKQQAMKLISYSCGIVAYECLLTGVYPTVVKSPAVAEIVDSFPSSVKGIFGVSTNTKSVSFEAYISGQFFSRIWTLIMSIYGINTADALVAKLVENGFMSFPLSTPVARTTIMVTQIAVLLTGFALLTGVTILGLFGGATAARIAVDAWPYWRLGLLGFTFFSTIGAYNMLFSALFNEERQTLLSGAVLTFVFYGLDVIARINPKFSTLGKFTVFGLFRVQDLLEGKVDSGESTVLLAGLALGLYVLSVLVFAVKDIPV